MENISAKVILIQKCEDCPYREFQEKEIHFCWHGMFPLSSDQLHLIHDRCKLDDIEIEEYEEIIDTDD